MLKRGVAICLALLVMVAAAGLAVAVAPSAPRLAVLRLTPDRAESKIAILTPGGGSHRHLLAVSPQPGRELGLLSVPAWSPDGELLAFSHRRGKRWAIVLAPADGGSPQPVPGTRGGILPVFSPDGRSLAFTRVRHERKLGKRSYELYESSSVWVVDLETGERRQLTRWRDELDQLASSFSPDGATLLVTRIDRRRSGDPETVALRFDGRTSSLLVGEGAFPVYSPDGSKIALFRQRVSSKRNDLYVIDADGSHLRRLTYTVRKDELFASWDPSGERIAYSQFREFEPGEAAAIVEINADGTCPTRVLSRSGVAFIGPAWEPGSGREAGRISC